MYKRFIVTFASGIVREFIETAADIRATADFYAPSFGRIVSVKAIG